jgi:hypothetical protein
MVGTGIAASLDLPISGALKTDTLKTATGQKRIIIL